MPGYRGKSSTLAITATPFKSSRLAIPPSPFSPRTPLAIQLTLNFSSKFSQASAIYAAPAPPSPLSWLWQCHQCHQSYQLGVTRRCLDDGHHFCTGTTTVKTRRASTAQRRKRHKACASEFDYQGWKAWGRWKRTGLHHDKAHYTNAQTRNKKDCWNTCNYPSECRWGKQFGIHSPVEPDFPTVQSAEEPVGPGGVLKLGLLWWLVRRGGRVMGCLVRLLIRWWTGNQRAGKRLGWRGYEVKTVDIVRVLILCKIRGHDSISIVGICDFLRSAKHIDNYSFQ